MTASSKAQELVKLSTNPAKNRKTNQPKQIQDISTPLDQLIAKQHAAKSFISRIAAWYHARSMWIKVSLGLLNTGIGALIGVLFMSTLMMAPIFGAMVGLALYLLPSLILVQHHHTDTKQKAALMVEITHRERVLKESIASLHALEEPLTEVLTSLENKNIEKEEDITRFKASVSSFGQNLDEAKSSMASLKNQQAALANTNQLLDGVIKQTAIAHAELNQNHMDLTQSNHALSETQGLLQQEVNMFHALNSEIAQTRIPHLIL
jgi:hypothetical protein